jgi:DNA polymerase-3 subunit epsilon
MYTFTAIDFETSNAEASSICQIGLIHVKNGKVEKEFNLLIQPPRNHYLYNFIRVHGIKPEDTALAPTFNQVWNEIEPFIRGQHIVAHNAPFDTNCLRATLQYYHISVPRFTTHCTYKIYKKGLAKLAAEHQIPLKHHDALSDARACAILFTKHLNESGIRFE